MTDEAIAKAHVRFVDDVAHGLIAQAIAVLASRSAVAGVLEVDPTEILHLVACGGVSSGIELGLRAALLDPDAAERIRDSFAATIHAGEGRDPAGLGRSLAKAQEYLDRCLADG